MDSNYTEKIDDFFASRSLSRRTEDLYRIYLRRVLSWLYEEGKDLRVTTQREVKDWLEAEGLGNSACYNCSVALRQFCVWLWGESHPLAHLKARLRDPGPQRTMTFDEVETVLEFLKQPQRLPTDEDRRVFKLAMFRLFLDTGLRASELAGLKIENLDLAERKLSVLGKGSKWRTSVYSPETSAALSEWLRVREKWIRNGVNTVFCGIGGHGKEAGKPLTRWGLFQIVEDIGKSAGLKKKISPHALRRTGAVLATKKGAPARIVMAQYGWNSFEMLQRYTKAITADDYNGYFVELK
jgi:site-specific recombinase XerD